ncbi:ABC transporter ATP-binding protein [bacterium]|nr:ABC transporter ATP-binding protein [bacterium]
MALLSAKNITKIYQAGSHQLTVLKNVDLTIKKGEFVAIIGKSGSGKSTLMNILGCLDTATSGTYKIANKNVSHLTVDQLAQIRNEQVGFVFQQYHLLPDMTALENVMLPLLYAHKTEEFSIKQAKKMLSLVDLADRIDHLPSEMSGGEQQRVAIARALSNNPNIVLADEPTGNLDSVTETIIMKLFKNLHKKQGATIVMITHDEHVAKQASRIIRLHDGKVVKTKK